MGTHLSRLGGSEKADLSGPLLHQSVSTSEEDVYAARRILHNFLPPELVDIVLDFSMYWPSIVYETTRSEIVTESSGDLIYLIGQPLLQDRLPAGSPVNLKVVKFSLESHDQGWGGEPNMPGPYYGAWSWFEAAIFRATSPHFVWPEEIQDVSKNGDIEQVVNIATREKTWHLQRNIRASPLVARHEVEWFKSDVCNIDAVAEGDEDHDTGSGLGIGFVSSLVAGDRIAVIAKAQFPGWKNHIYSAKIEIFYSM